VILPRVMTKNTRNLALELATPYFAYKYDLVLVPSHVCLSRKQHTTEIPVRSHDYLEGLVMLSRDTDKVCEDLAHEIATISYT
jgi:hypothetical protein